MNAEENQSTHHNQSEPSGHDVRDEHGTIIKAWAEEIFLPAFGAMFRHVEWFLKRESARFEEVTFVATRAFQFGDAICFASFFEHDFGKSEARHEKPDFKIFKSYYEDKSKGKKVNYSVIIITFS